MSKIKIFLSPGHNEFLFDNEGSKGGKYSDGIFEEFNFNVDVVEEISKLLKPYENFEIIQLEFDNEKIDNTLRQRIDKINKMCGENDLIVSIHANAGDKQVKGMWGFWGSSRGFDFLNIFSKLVKDSMIPYTKNYKCVFNTWTEFGIVLRTKPVAVLLELGFFTNEHDRKILRTPIFKKYCAEKIFKSILIYYGVEEIKKNESKKTWDQLIKRTQFPNEWIKQIKKGVEITNKYDLGELDFIKHLPELLEVIGND